MSFFRFKAPSLEAHIKLAQSFEKEEWGSMPTIEDHASKSLAQPDYKHPIELIPLEQDLLGFGTSLFLNSRTKCENTPVPRKTTIWIKNRKIEAGSGWFLLALAESEKNRSLENRLSEKLLLALEVERGLIPRAIPPSLSEQIAICLYMMHRGRSEIRFTNTGLKLLDQLYAKVLSNNQPSSNILYRESVKILINIMGNNRT